LIKAEWISEPQSDLTVVNAARVSFDKQSNWMSEAEVPTNPHTGGKIPPYKRLKERDARLINYLASHNHWTPFGHVRETFCAVNPLDSVFDLSDCAPEDIAGMVWAERGRFVRHSLWGWKNLLHKGVITGNKAETIRDSLTQYYPASAKALDLEPTGKIESGKISPVVRAAKLNNPLFIDVTMRETVPIFVARQRFKHMTGFVYNEVSRRYVDDEPELYVPDVWRQRAENKKQGSSIEPVQEPLRQYPLALEGTTTARAYENTIGSCTDLYRDMIDGNVAPEQARMVLPQSMLTSYYVTANLTSWARAYRERSQPDAQKEIRDLAEQWDGILCAVAQDHWVKTKEGDK
jgi:thymidylate synthase (FAD)